jgi:hypothetical protein
MLAVVIWVLLQVQLHSLFTSLKLGCKQELLAAVTAQPSWVRLDELAVTQVH